MGPVSTMCDWDLRLENTASSSHILTKFMVAQRRTAIIFVTQDVGCASCMCDWGIREALIDVWRGKIKLLISSWLLLDRKINDPIFIISS